MLRVPNCQAQASPRRVDWEAQGSATDTVLAAAQVQRDVILHHRTDAKLARATVRTLMDELAGVSLNGEHMRRIMAATCERLDDQEARALAEDFKVAFKVPFKLRARTSSLQRLVDALQRAHGFERKAFGIADDDAGTSPLDTMTTAELEAEIARLDGERAAQA